MQLLRVHILIESTSSNTNAPELGGAVNRAVELGWDGQNKTLKDPQRPTLVFPNRKTGLVRGGADVMKRARIVFWFCVSILSTGLIVCFSSCLFASSRVLFISCQLELVSSQLYKQPQTSRFFFFVRFAYFFPTSVKRKKRWAYAFLESCTRHRHSLSK